MQIHEQAHIVVATLAGGFIDAEPRDVREISSLTGLVHVMVQDAPQTRVMLTNIGGEGLDRHGESRHASQKLTENSDGSLLFEVEVAEPEEVLWWALRWGGNFEIIEPQWLRDEAIKTIRKMAQRYKKQ